MKFLLVQLDLYFVLVFTSSLHLKLDWNFFFLIIVMNQYIIEQQFKIYIYRSEKYLLRNYI